MNFFLSLWSLGKCLSTVYKGEEYVTDVSADVFAKWRVEPEDVVTLSVSLFGSRGWLVVKSVVVYAFVKCFLVLGGGLVERCFVR